VAGSAPAVATTAAAERILAAAAARHTFVFVQPNPKTRKSRERYEVKKVETTTFTELDALE
jgi:hypothetical protein